MSSDKEYKYTMNVCAAQTETGGACSGAAICQYRDKTPREYVAQLGKFGTADGQPKWEELKNGEGVILEYSNGTPCFLPGETKREVWVNLKCASKTATTFTIVEDTDPTKCHFDLVLNTNVVCKGGLSGGSVLLIIVVVALPIYIAVGCIFNVKKRGLSGKEACPQYAFWSEIPTLAKEGCMFCKNKITGKKGGESYDEL